MGNKQTAKRQENAQQKLTNRITRFNNFIKQNVILDGNGVTVRASKKKDNLHSSHNDICKTCGRSCIDINHCDLYLYKRNYSNENYNQEHI